MICRPGLLACLMLVVCACAPVREDAANSKDSGIDIDGITIRNQLLYPVTDVMVEVPATGGFAGCGNILGRSQCSTSFPAADYKQNAIVVSWKEYGEPHRTAEFVVQIPAGMEPGSVAWLEVIVFASGQAGAKLVSPPGP